MNGENENKGEGQQENTQQQSGDQNSTQTPPTAPTEGASVETGDANQGGAPSPAEGTGAAAGSASVDGASSAEAAPTDTIKLRVSGALTFEGDVDPKLSIGEALKKANVTTAPSNFNLRDAVTGNLLKLSDMVATLSTVDAMKRGAVEATAKGSQASVPQSGGRAAEVTSTRRASGG